MSNAALVMMRPSSVRSHAVLVPDITEIDVRFSVDGERFAITVPSDLSALRAIREIARHDRPRRGCEAGLCGKCESLVDGREQRLCQLPAPELDGLTIVTPTPRKSLWG